MYSFLLCIHFKHLFINIKLYLYNQIKIYICTFKLKCNKIKFIFLVWYEPTDVNKATRVFKTKSQWQNVLHFISPNRNELSIIGKYLGIPVPDNKLFMDLEEIKAIAEQIAEFIPVVISTLGSHGVLVNI